MVGGNPRTAQLVGLPATALILAACGLGGGFAGIAGAVEVAAVHTNANASLIAGYGYSGILVSFIARHNPIAVIPVAILFGGFGAAGSLLQRRLGLPDASVLVLQGLAFVLILASEGLRMIDWKTLLKNRMPQAVQPRACRPARGGRADDRARPDGSPPCWIALVRHHRRRAARRRAVPVREPRRMPDREVGPHQPRPRRRAGAVGHGLLRRLVPHRLGLARRADRRRAGALLALLHGLLCSLDRVNDVATGIALMLFGTGLAFYLGKPLIQPQAPQLPAIPLGFWTDNQVIRSALQVNALVPIGVVLAIADVLGLRAHARRPAGAHGRRLGQRDPGAGLFGLGAAHRGDHRGRRDRRASAAPR